MKSRKELSKKYKILLFCLILLILIISIFCVRYLTQKVNLAQKYKNISPNQTLVSKDELITKIYFNNKLGETTALDPIVDIINNAKYKIEIAMFSFDSNKIKEALYKASNNGVKVTLILDASRKQKHDTIFTNLPANITRIDIGDSSQNISTSNIYMHHKLLIADQGFDTEKMITGSIDYTNKGAKYEQSFYLVSSDKMLIDTYEKEINFLKNKYFGKTKLEKNDYNPWAAHIEYSDSFVDVWFSPGYSTNSVKYKIIEEIQKAQKSINLVMWQFTDKDIADALIKKAKENISVKIIAEDLVADSKGSNLPYIKDMAIQNKLKNIEIVLDTKSNNEIDLSKLRPGFSAFIHHHFMIIDDKNVIFGTNNWSNWGFYKNDEDTIITNNTLILSEFKKNFDYFYKVFR
jgi:phosphatidylserine/phosphatidylglycerophosphate/cardiolipin synthase-like enzyme